MQQRIDRAKMVDYDPSTRDARGTPAQWRTTAEACRAAARRRPPSAQDLIERARACDIMARYAEARGESATASHNASTAYVLNMAIDDATGANLDAARRLREAFARA